MSDLPNTNPSSVSLGSSSVSARVIHSGQQVLPLDRIKLYSNEDWEKFVTEWIHSLKDKYSRVDRLGGAGDMGRDVVAVSKDDPDVWDNYQCKHYKNALTPSNIWTELGKLVYYTQQVKFTYPRRYYFVAPQGASTTLLSLLKDPAKLKQELLSNWDTHCRTKITDKSVVKLDATMKAYIKTLDFSIFDAIPPLQIIDGHAKTPYHIVRFGLELPPRPDAPEPPLNPASLEARYIRQLFDAYGDHLTLSISDISDISHKPSLCLHYSNSREEFYSAEALRTFSRDNLPDGEFEKLQKEIYSGFFEEYIRDHPDGYERVLAVVRTAKSLFIINHSLSTRLSHLDKGGICHQLANNDKIKWV